MDDIFYACSKQLCVIFDSFEMIIKPLDYVPEQFEHKLNYFLFCLIFEYLFIIFVPNFFDKITNLEDFDCQV